MLSEEPSSLTPQQTNFISKVLSSFDGYKKESKSIKQAVASGNQNTISLILQTSTGILQQSNPVPIILLNCIRVIKEAMDTRNEDFITILLQSNVLQYMFEIGSFRSGDGNEDRGELFFHSENLSDAENEDNAVVGNSLLRIVLECLMFWPLMFPEQEYLADIFEQLSLNDVTFPTTINYFKSFYKGLLMTATQSSNADPAEILPFEVSASRLHAIRAEQQLLQQQQQNNSSISRPQSLLRQQQQQSLLRQDHQMNSEQFSEAHQEQVTQSVTINNNNSNQEQLIEIDEFSAQINEKCALMSDLLEELSALLLVPTLKELNLNNLEEVMNRVEGCWHECNEMESATNGMQEKLNQEILSTFLELNSLFMDIIEDYSLFSQNQLSFDDFSKKYGIVPIASNSIRLRVSVQDRNSISHPAQNRDQPSEQYVNHNHQQIAQITSNRSNASKSYHLQSKDNSEPIEQHFEINRVSSIKNPQYTHTISIEDQPKNEGEGNKIDMDELDEIQYRTHTHITTHNDYQDQYQQIPQYQHEKEVPQLQQHSSSQEYEKKSQTNQQQSQRRSSNREANTSQQATAPVPVRNNSARNGSMKENNSISNNLESAHFGEKTATTTIMQQREQESLKASQSATEYIRVGNHSQQRQNNFSSEQPQQRSRGASFKQLFEDPVHISIMKNSSLPRRSFCKSTPKHDESQADSYASMSEHQSIRVSPSSVKFTLEQKSRLISEKDILIDELKDTVAVYESELSIMREQHEQRVQKFEAEIARLTQSRNEQIEESYADVVRQKEETIQDLLLKNQSLKERIDDLELSANRVPAVPYGNSRRGSIAPEKKQLVLENELLKEKLAEQLEWTAIIERERDLLAQELRLTQESLGTVATAAQNVFFPESANRNKRLHSETRKTEESVISSPALLQLPVSSDGKTENVPIIQISPNSVQKQEMQRVGINEGGNSTELIFVNTENTATEGGVEGQKEQSFLVEVITRNHKENIEEEERIQNQQTILQVEEIFDEEVQENNNLKQNQPEVEEPMRVSLRNTRRYSEQRRGDINYSNNQQQVEEEEEKERVGGIKPVEVKDEEEDEEEEAQFSVSPSRPTAPNDYRPIFVRDASSSLRKNFSTGIFTPATAAAAAVNTMNNQPQMPLSQISQQFMEQSRNARTELQSATAVSAYQLDQMKVVLDFQEHEDKQEARQSVKNQSGSTVDFVAGGVATANTMMTTNMGMTQQLSPERDQTVRQIRIEGMPSLSDYLKEKHSFSNKSKDQNKRSLFPSSLARTGENEGDQNVNGQIRVNNHVASAASVGQSLSTRNGNGGGLVITGRKDAGKKVEDAVGSQLESRRSAWEEDFQSERTLSEAQFSSKASQFNDSVVTEEVRRQNVQMFNNITYPMERDEYYRSRSVADQIRMQEVQSSITMTTAAGLILQQQQEQQQQHQSEMAAWRRRVESERQRIEAGGEIVEMDHMRFQNARILSAENLNRMKKACLAEKTLLFENDIVKIGVLSSSHFFATKQFLKLQLYFFNRNSAIQNPKFSLDYLINEDISVWTKPERLEGELDMQKHLKQELIIDINAIPYDLLTAHFKLEIPDMLLPPNRRLLQPNLIEEFAMLPIALNRFVEYSHVNANIMRKRWEENKEHSISTVDFEFNTKVLSSSLTLLKYFKQCVELNPHQREEHLAGLADFGIGGIFVFHHLPNNYLQIRIIASPFNRIRIAIAPIDAHPLQEDTMNACYHLIQTYYFLFHDPTLFKPINQQNSPLQQQQPQQQYVQQRYSPERDSLLQTHKRSTYSFHP